jgi:ABC-type dipeptide/oligopeptide/nickel transport system permease subunit
MPLDIDFSAILTPPWRAWFGTDAHGRYILSRIIFARAMRS